MNTIFGSAFCYWVDLGDLEQHTLLLHSELGHCWLEALGWTVELAIGIPLEWRYFWDASSKAGCI